MDSGKIITVRCPVATIATLNIPIALTRNNISYTRDPRAIHMLRKSFFIFAAIDINGEPKNIPCTEFIPNLTATKKGSVRIPGFGVLNDKIAWISPQAVFCFGKSGILKNLPEIIGQHFAAEVNAMF